MESGNYTDKKKIWNPSSGYTIDWKCLVFNAKQISSIAGIKESFQNKINFEGVRHTGLTAIYTEPVRRTP